MDEDKKTKKPKNHKLVIEIGIISIVFFTAILLFTIALNYSVTKDSYLTSKNEMVVSFIATISYINKLLPKLFIATIPYILYFLLNHKM